jgi:HD-GYP domain-containing protein (c-di-GMP phosphodiesterase class II)
MNSDVSDDTDINLEQGSNHYASHLAEVNERNEVTSNQDIVNSRGVLLVKKGSRIDSSAVEKIVKHKLTQPIDEQISIKDSINNEKLIEHSVLLLQKYPDLGDIVAGHQFTEKLKENINKTNIPNLIFQNLTVLHHQQPNLYEKSLYTAILCCLIADQLEMEPIAIRRTFTAGLVHDIGLLRIDPTVLNKKDQLSAGEWRMIQGHVVIGEMMIKSMQGIAEETARAVIEHHERCDGTGYPLGKNESSLSLTGQIVAIADSLQAIRVNQFAHNGLNLVNALPYLNMNSSTFFDRVYRAVYQLIRQAQIEPGVMPFTPSLSLFSGEIARRCAGLQDSISPLQKVFRTIIPLHTNKRGSAVKRVNHRVVQKINQSGILSPDLTEWLRTLTDNDNDKATLIELNNTHLILNELTWQLESMRKVLGEYLENESDPEHSSHEILASELNTITNCLNSIR